MAEVRSITDDFDRFNELPTQIAYHLRRMQNALTELGAGDGENASSLMERIQALETAQEESGGQSEDNANAITSLNNTVTQLQSDVSDLQNSLNSSPTDGKTLSEWAEETQTAIDNLGTGLQEVQDALGTRPSNVSAGSTVWDEVGALKTSVATLQSQNAALSTALTNRVDQVEDTLNGSPVAGQTLSQWADASETRLDDLEASQQAQDALLNDLTISW